MLRGVMRSGWRNTQGAYSCSYSPARVQVAWMVAGCREDCSCWPFVPSQTVDVLANIVICVQPDCRVLPELLVWSMLSMEYLASQRYTVPATMRRLRSRVYQG